MRIMDYFFQYDASGSTGVSVNVRSDTSGLAVDTSIIQNYWDIDKMMEQGQVDII